jgi:hypothetical protein
MSSSPRAHPAGIDPKSLPDGGELQDGDLLIVNRGGKLYRVTFAQLSSSTTQKARELPNSDPQVAGEWFKNGTSISISLGSGGGL